MATIPPVPCSALPGLGRFSPPARVPGVMEDPLAQPIFVAWYSRALAVPFRHRRRGTPTSIHRRQCVESSTAPRRGALVNLTRLAVVVLLAIVVLLPGGGPLVAAAPARAADTFTDLELAVVGTRVAAGANGKIGWARISNHGPGTPSSLTITADLAELDFLRLISVPGGTDCALDAVRPAVVCAVAPETIPAPGQSADVPLLHLRRSAEGGPYRGRVTYRIDSPEDRTPENNTREVSLEVADRDGVDLGTRVFDVTRRAGDAPGGPLRPGDRGMVRGIVYNVGGLAAEGIELIARLPRGVTFADNELDCAYDLDRRVATCRSAEWVLEPFGESPDEGIIEVAFPVLVATDLPAPINLCAGSWTIRALGVIGERAGRRGPAEVLPGYARRVPGWSSLDVDDSDNTDHYTVVVHDGEVPPTGGCGDPADGGDGGDDGDDGDGVGGGDGDGGSGLPVTGARAVAHGGAGVAVIVAGGLLLLAVRRPPYRRRDHPTAPGAVGAGGGLAEWRA
jgi:hypothetical protein